MMKHLLPLRRKAQKHKWESETVFYVHQLTTVLRGIAPPLLLRLDFGKFGAEDLRRLRLGSVQRSSNPFGALIGVILIH
jgi:hypothetical protein